ncbi:hypothetical protein DMX05_03435 [Pseudomonas soli]|nr:hypothetical protein DMX05_03435 [Pseudomonas soli]
MTVDQSAIASLVLSAVQTLLTIITVLPILGPTRVQWLRRTSFRAWVLSMIGVLSVGFGRDLYLMISTGQPDTLINILKVNGYLMGALFYIALGVWIWRYWKKLDQISAP